MGSSFRRVIVWEKWVERKVSVYLGADEGISGILMSSVVCRSSLIVSCSMGMLMSSFCLWFADERFCGR